MILQTVGPDTMHGMVGYRIIPYSARHVPNLHVMHVRHKYTQLSRHCFFGPDPDPSLTHSNLMTMRRKTKTIPMMRTTTTKKKRSQSLMTRRTKRKMCWNGRHPQIHWMLHLNPAFRLVEDPCNPVKLDIDLASFPAFDSRLFS